jgi:hypothetical protein
VRLFISLNQSLISLDSIDAIFGTDIGLPVAERVAVGLASVGLSTTVTLACELLIVDMFLRIIDVQVIRQLITFTAVALVVDYCLEMSFFVTILSIDIQRLEVSTIILSLLCRC